MAEPVTGWEFVFKYIIPATTGIITVAIAGAAAYIAKKQYNINQAQKELLSKKQEIEAEDHQLKKYDKRISTFIALEVFFEMFERDGLIKPDTIRFFYENVWLNRFLFSKEIKDFFYQLRDAMISNRYLIRRLEIEPAGNARNELSQKETDLLNWFISQQQGLDDKFEPYLLVQ